MRWITVLYPAPNSTNEYEPAMQIIKNLRPIATSPGTNERNRQTSFGPTSIFLTLGWTLNPGIKIYLEAGRPHPLGSQIRCMYMHQDHYGDCYGTPASFRALYYYNGNYRESRTDRLRLHGVLYLLTHIHIHGVRFHLFSAPLFHPYIHTLID